MAEQPTPGWWSRKIWVLVLFPTGAAALLAVVGVFKGWLHRQVGFDDSGRPVIEAKDKEAAKNGEPPQKPRPSISSKVAYDRMFADLGRRDVEDRPRVRYLTLLHRHNEPSCTAEELESWRHAVVEMVAVLSRGHSASGGWIDPDQLLFRLDMGEMGWDPLTDWRKLVSHYRYGLRVPDGDPVASRQGEVERLTGDRIPVVRGDWFVVALCRPPLAGTAGLLRKPAVDLPESIRSPVKKYSAQTLDLPACAGELGLEDGKTLADLIGRHENLQQEFGLAPLLEGERIRREWWESDRHFYSPYQEAARLLKLGKPVRVQ